MTPEITANQPSEQLNPQPLVRGLTAKVVKGSLWTLAGQIAPLALTLLATPFTIRLLGAEGYGVLILVGLIPTYANFADFGMGLGSTKYASEAYSANDSIREARIVRTAALISFLASFPIGLAMFIFSTPIIRLFNVPDHLVGDGSVALKFASITFVVNFLNNIFNTPQLTRLRMDLNTLISSCFRVVGIVATPIVVYLGFGIVGATLVLMVAALATLAGHLAMSHRLLPELYGLSVDRSIARPLLRFGGGLVIGGVAAVLLVNLEKAVLARATNVETLAYYSVAFNFAMMATMFSGAMIQSLLPAFSQLLIPEKREQLNKLFSRALRINIFGMLPILAFLFVIARPLFTIWAGPDFGRESTLPFYVILGGLFFNIIAFLPASLLLAFGRSDLTAKLYWVELFPYLGLIAVLTTNLGSIGAALAWSTRVFVDAIVITYLCRKTVGVSFDLLNGSLSGPFVALLILAPPMVIAALTPNFSNWLLLMLAISICLYTVLAWKKFLAHDEKLWLRSKFDALFVTRRSN